MIGIYEINSGHGRRQIAAHFPQFRDAKEYLRKNFDIAVFEDDPDCSNAADIITRDGRQLAIEPM